MRNLLIGLLGAGVLATAGYAAAAGLDDADPARTVSLPAATTGGTTTVDTTTLDTTTAASTTVGTTTTDEAEDISGPCDEAEHENDPRGTGAVAADGDDDDHADEDDRSGSRHGGEDDGDDEDRSGSNSGRG